MIEKDLFCGNEFCGFKLINCHDVAELEYTNSKQTDKHRAYQLKHKSGARLLYLENEDPEMAFGVGFKTLPKDSTGVFHILEHSVLCGSRKFPVKEPFTNLLKSSMQTFLNALTYPDKTFYPVASTNEKDLYNLIDIYMDAVFFPNIYKNPNIFYQEGGHPVLKSKDKKSFNGVVYNEMKGVYSEPQEHLFDGLLSQLFPESCYSYSSGGDPKVIPSLTYEEYLAQHNTNYCLENSYIIVYGNLDIKKMLQFLDNNYLSLTDEMSKWRNGVGKTQIGTLQHNYTNTSSTKKIEVKTSKDNAECGAAFVINRDSKKQLAAKILIDALASSNESPLKKALLSKNFAADIDFDILNEIYQPFIFVECKNTLPNVADKFFDTLTEEIKNLSNKGISKDLIRASISNNEFILREKNPSFTTGVDCALTVMNSWLYDENDPVSSIKYIDDIEFLKSQIDTDYFDKLANEIFVDNKHTAKVEIIPCDKDNFCDIEKTNEDQSKQIEKLCSNLEKWQASPDTQEDEAKLPVMKKSDVGKINLYPETEKLDYAPNCFRYKMSSNSISHINRYYPLNNLDMEELKYAAVLCLCLGKLRTTKHSAEEIDLISQEKIGHLDFACSIFEDFYDYNKLDVRLSVRSSALEENNDYLANFVDEILYETQFDDYDKIKTIINQQKVYMEQNFISNGHTSSLSRALSYILPRYVINEQTCGVDFYIFIKNILNNFDNNAESICQKLTNLSSKVFANAPTISFVASDKSIKSFFEQTKINFDESKQGSSIKINCENKKEAFLIPSNVNYCAMANDLRLHNSNSKKSGSLIVASKIIGLDYLWNEVRVKNGAYGAGMLVVNRGTMQFYSYRDPKLKKTFDNYANSCKWLANTDFSDQTLDNYIISSVAKIDAPQVARNIMLTLDNYYFSGIDQNKRTKTRQQMIDTKLKDIKDAGQTFLSVIDSSAKCVFGSQNIEKLKDDGFKIIDLFKL